MNVVVEPLSRSVEVAAQIFRTFREGKPDLIKTGLTGVDKKIGGVSHGSLSVVGAKTGVGKSTLAFTACVEAGGGIISTEDGVDVVGSRALAMLSGVDSLKIRTKSFSQAEAVKLKEAMARIHELDHVQVAYCVGKGLEAVLQSVQPLKDAGCKVVWLDYLQKIRGVSADRRQEVAIVLNEFQAACVEANVAGFLVSQFSRQQGDLSEVPDISWLKESGDIENEARIIVLMHRDKHDHGLLRCRVAKSTFGGEGTYFSYRRTARGFEAVNAEKKHAKEEF